MPCTRVKMLGGYAILCGRGPRVKTCSVCGALADKLCDYPLFVEGKRRTCNAPLCGKCAVHQHPDQDFCPHHPGLKL